MRLIVKNPQSLKLILQSLSRFVRKGHIEASESGLRLQSIDPHDFCYSDLILGKEFFESFKSNGRIEMDLDLSRIFKITPYLATSERLELDLGPLGLQITTRSPWASTFRIAPSLTRSFPFERLPTVRFDATANVGASEFMGEIRKAAAISHEITFRIDGKGLELMAESGDYRFDASESGISSTRAKKAEKDAVSSSAIVDYIRQLGTLIERAERITLHLARDAPLELEFSIKEWGRFSFYLSHRKLDLVPQATRISTGDSLPRISMTKLPDYCLYVSNRQSPVPARELVLNQLETQGRDYTRLARRLSFVTSQRSGVRLTKRGREWVDLYTEDVDRAKKSLHGSALRLLPPYKQMVARLLQRPMSQDEIQQTLNSARSSHGKRLLDRQDISTLLGIAIWTGTVDRNLGLYYFGRGAD